MLVFLFIILLYFALWLNKVRQQIGVFWFHFIYFYFFFFFLREREIFSLTIYFTIFIPGTVLSEISIMCGKIVEV